MSECVVAIAYKAGLIEEPIPHHCSEDTVEIYHGYVTPSVACGVHGYHALDAVRRARKALHDAQTQHPEEP